MAHFLRIKRREGGHLITELLGSEDDHKHPIVCPRVFPLRIGRHSRQNRVFVKDFYSDGWLQLRLRVAWVYVRIWFWNRRMQCTPSDGGSDTFTAGRFRYDWVKNLST